MNIALIVTTINVPHFLKLLKHYPGVSIFVAADHKTPDEAYAMCAEIPNCEIYSPQRQQELGYACSDIIGWNCIQRKNVVLLEAIRDRADLIISTDDDNLRMKPDYFHQFAKLFDYRANGDLPLSGIRPWSGLQVSTNNGWFDPGQLLVPPVRHRGLPMEAKTEVPELSPADEIKIGVAAGLWVGDGDVDAANRIAIPPAIHSATELAQVGVAVAHNTQTVFNAQNIAFVRELAPATFLAPGLGRSDDIFASLICQRIMRERGLHVHFGQPFTACWQDRSKESLLHDLAGEFFGMHHVTEFSEYLAGFSFSGTTVVQQVREIYSDLQHCAWWPAIASETALAFLDDIEKVL